MSEKFVENLNHLIKEKGLNRSKLGQKIGISESTMRSWDKGCEPTVDKVIKISQYFAIPIAELLGLEERFPNDEELLSYFHKLPEREQIKWIGKLEEAAAQFTKQETADKIS